MESEGSAKGRPDQEALDLVVQRLVDQGTKEGWATPGYWIRAGWDAALASVRPPLSSEDQLTPLVICLDTEFPDLDLVADLNVLARYVIDFCGRHNPPPAALEGLAGYEMSLAEVRTEMSAWSKTTHYHQGSDEADAIRRERHLAVKDALENVEARLVHRIEIVRSALDHSRTPKEQKT